MILGLDSGFYGASAALVRGGRIVVQRGTQIQRDGGENLADLVNAIGAKADDVQCIAVTVGPGSFTGIRVAIASALGLAKGWNKKLFGVPTLVALCYAVPAEARKNKAVFAIEPSGKGDYYAGAIDAGGAWILPSYATPTPQLPDSLRGALTVGRGIADSFPIDAPLAGAAALFAEAHLAQIEKFPPAPIYLRGADVTLKSA